MPPDNLNKLTVATPFSTVPMNVFLPTVIFTVPFALFPMTMLATASLG